MKNTTTVTLYAATQKVWGATYPRTVYFETIQERNAFVKKNDFTDKAGTVKLNPTQFAQWKEHGEWDRYAE